MNQIPLSRRWLLRAIVLAAVVGFAAAYAPEVEAGTITVTIRNRTSEPLEFKVRGTNSIHTYYDKLQPGKARIYTIDSSSSFAGVYVKQGSSWSEVYYVQSGRSYEFVRVSSGALILRRVG